MHLKDSQIADKSEFERKQLSGSAQALPQLGDSGPRQPVDPLKNADSTTLILEEVRKDICTQ